MPPLPPHNKKDMQNYKWRNGLTHARVNFWQSERKKERAPPGAGGGVTEKIQNFKLLLTKLALFKKFFDFILQVQFSVLNRKISVRNTSCWFFLISFSENYSKDSLIHCVRFTRVRNAWEWKWKIIRLSRKMLNLNNQFQLFAPGKYLEANRRHGRFQ